jgi:hypothetical protein
MLAVHQTYSVSSTLRQPFRRLERRDRTHGMTRILLIMMSKICMIIGHYEQTHPAGDLAIAYGNCFRDCGNFVSEATP